jgi:hypothetical protein
MPLEFVSTPIVIAPAAGSAGITLTPSATFYTNSGWSTVIASTSNAIVLVGVYISDGPASMQVDIGTGGAGSEVVVGTVMKTSPQDRTYYFPIPIDNVGSGVRVAARIRGEAATAARVRVVYYDGTGLPGFTATVNACLVLPVVTPGGAFVDVPTNGVWTNGAWTTLVASSSNAYAITGIAAWMSSLSVEYEVDLGVGGAGSEVVIATHRATRFASTRGGIEQGLLKPAYATVASSSRIAARVRHEQTGVNNARVFFYAYQMPI